MAGKNNRVLQTLIIGGIGIYALNKLLAHHATTAPGVSPPGSFLTTQSYRQSPSREIVSQNYDNDNTDSGVSSGSEVNTLPEGNNPGLTPKQRPKPEPKPIPPPPPPVPQDASNPKASIMAGLGNLFTEVISRITPQDAAIFYYSEKDVLDNERIFIKKMTRENAALCKAYLQWPARKLRKSHSRKIFY
jgi:hypothetical protein